MDRQDFLKHGLNWLGLKLIEQTEQATAPLRQRTFLRPPGAQAEALFLSLCTRCDACTAACPHETISVHYGSGPPQDGTPVLLNLNEHPCLMCEDTPCISACPTEALMPVNSIKEIDIGVALLDTLTCSGFRGSGCRICYDICPLPDQAIQLVEGLPFIQETDCTGCGICAHHCPDEAIEIIQKTLA